MAEANGKIDLVALEIGEANRRRDPQVDVGVLIIETRQPGQQPFGREGRGYADRQSSLAERRPVVADRSRKNLQPSLDVRQHPSCRIGKGDETPRSLEQPRAQQLLE